MGRKNEKTIARSEETQPQSVSIARGGRLAGRESEASGNQQERNYRANSSESSILSAGTTITGGMLDHLINEYCDQVTAKESEVERINDEIKRLRTRVQEFKALREELHKQTEDN